MNFDHDRHLLVRADLADQLDLLRLTHFDSNPVQFLLRLESIRQNAFRHQFHAVAEIAAVFEDALQRIIASGGSENIVSNFTHILSDAIGCKQLDAAVSQSLLASVAVRMQG